MTDHTNTDTARPDDVEPDPRTDGVGDGGERDLPPLADEEIETTRTTEREVTTEARSRGVLADDGPTAPEMPHGQD